MLFLLINRVLINHTTRCIYIYIYIYIYQIILKAFKTLGIKAFYGVYVKLTIEPKTVGSHSSHSFA